MVELNIWCYLALNIWCNSIGLYRYFIGFKSGIIYTYWLSKLCKNKIDSDDDFPLEKNIPYV